ncbi:tRNA pseudouridine synthase D [Halomonadaceae bacterium LMG 33818]|uniref:tRNA pseudouridine(13) synthase TruD n=1 Tax=Cernens ardua TaxID=3402176 RepID=UPI003EDB7AC4
MTDVSREASSVLPEWSRVFKKPPQGCFKATPEDFSVTEELGFVPEAFGPHLWCWVEKRGIDTLQAISILSRVTGLPAREIGYSGLKDRQAVTYQWLSLPLELLGQSDLAEEHIIELQQSGIVVLRRQRHPRKLKRGSHRANRFVITISFDEEQRDFLRQRWEQIVSTGVPNYFGPQRFGYLGQNISRSRALLKRGWSKKQDRKGLMLSSARSYLFNLTLSARVDAGSWNQALPGEVLNLQGSNSFFQGNKATMAEIAQRIAEFDVHPTAPLWGKGQLESELDARSVEQQAVQREAELIDGLERARVNMARRALRLVLEDAQWVDIEHAPVNAQVNQRASASSSPGLQGSARLSFSLPRGAYATAVLRELIAAEGL